MSARFAIAITSIHECFVAIERIRLRIAAGCTERCRRAGVVPIRCFGMSRMAGPLAKFLLSLP
jgi:hypothetical protein